eukprot:5084269-Pyramimonas_sp.AAC.1
MRRCVRYRVYQHRCKRYRVRVAGNGCRLDVCGAKRFYTVDGKGYIVDAKGYSVDAKGYIVDGKGYSVDAKGYIGDFAESPPQAGGRG